MINASDFTPPVTATDRRVYRIVPSIFPPVSVFDRVAQPDDLEAVFAIEAMTNDRLEDEAGNIRLVQLADRVTGPGSTPIMAAFTHLNPEGSRFTDHSFGSYYASFEIETAVAETKHHREIFLARTREAPIDVDMRVYVAKAKADLHDIRKLQGSRPELYAKDDYGASQAFARRLRANGSDGIIYDSVRDPGGTCVAIFRPRLLSDSRQERHLTYRWDGVKIAEVYEKKAFP